MESPKPPSGEAMPHLPAVSQGAAPRALRRLAALSCAAFLGSDSVLAQSPVPAPPTASAPSTRSSAVGFAVARYDVTGNTALDPATLDRLLADATGQDVTVPRIQRALVRLQQAYRDRGHLRAAVTLPRQPLTNGTVQIRVHEGASVHASKSLPQVAELPFWLVPTYDIRHFNISGNTTLTPEEIDSVLGPVAQPAATKAQLEKAVAQLQERYRAKGFPEALVTVPQQLLTDGTVAVSIREGSPAIAAHTGIEPTPEPVAPAPSPKPSGPAFEVRSYEVRGNTLLRPDVVEGVFTNAVGTNVTLVQIQQALGELQLAYRERGFATVSVGLPQQQLTNAVVQVQVTEGALVDIRVAGNRHFSEANVRRALPSLTTNALLNSRVFQRELDLANQNRDRQIYPTLGPGPEPATTSLTLRVKDRFPLHGRLDVNNHATPGTPDWRINAAANHNNLWQLDHQLGLSYGFSPQEYKSEGLVSDLLVNRPLIANYGAYYRMPIGDAVGVQEQIDANPRAFGYDEATRQFRLPPPGSRPDLTFYGSSSSSDTGVKLGAESVVSQTPLLTIVSQDTGQNLTINDAVGGCFNYPIQLGETKRLGFSFGPDFKRYGLESWNTNNFIITTVVTNAQGSQTIESRVASPQPKRSVDLDYLPLSVGLDYSQADAGGTFAANLGISFNVLGDRSDFVAAGYSPDTRAHYGKATLSLTRDQRVFSDWSLLLRANGQAATGALFSNEQFALGGVASVRGYYDGDDYGDSGWFTSVELRTPQFPVRVAGWNDVAWPVWLRGNVFMDYGQRYLSDATSAANPFQSLWGTGFGFSANINNHFDARLTVGWPLLDTLNTEAGAARAYFSIGGQF